MSHYVDAAPHKLAAENVHYSPASANAQFSLARFLYSLVPGQIQFARYEQSPLAQRPIKIVVVVVAVLVILKPVLSLLLLSFVFFLSLLVFFLFLLLLLLLLSLSSLLLLLLLLLLLRHWLCRCCCCSCYYPKGLQFRISEKRGGKGERESRVCSSEKGGDLQTFP